MILEPKDHPKYPPKAFTEHGALMAATILNSPQAVRMSVFVVRAFVAMRSLLMTQQDLAKKLAALERTLTARLDTHEHAISDIIQQIMLLLSPPRQDASQDPPRPRIGFSVRERRAGYRTKKNTDSKEGNSHISKAGHPVTDSLVGILGDKKLSEDAYK